MIAIDANAVVTMLIDDAELGSASRGKYTKHDFVAPDLLPYEFASVLRKLCRLGTVTPRAAEHALSDLRLVRLTVVITVRLVSARSSSATSYGSWNQPL